MLYDTDLYRSDSQQTKVNSKPIPNPKTSIKNKSKTKPLPLPLSPPPPPSLPPRLRTGTPPVADIFSPRPETPAPPPEFPFLASSSPARRHEVAPLPPTPPRPGRRQTRKALSADHAIDAIKHRLSFERALAEFPAPPHRAPSLPFFRSLPASPAMANLALGPDTGCRGDKAKIQWSSRSRPDPKPKSRSRSRSRSKYDQRGKRVDEEELRDKDRSMSGWGSDESDCPTITGIPATPSTASSNSGWDNFWSEPPSPAIPLQGQGEQGVGYTQKQKMTEATLIRDAYMKLRSMKNDERYRMDRETEGMERKRC